jgi:hypothetical protein
VTAQERLFNHVPLHLTNSIEQKPSNDLESLLFETVMAVASEHPHLKMEDYDLEVVRAQIIEPIAIYIQNLLTRPKNGQKPAKAQPPLIVSGDPGIGKTTLMMMIDEALSRLNLGMNFSARRVIGNGIVSGYYGKYKGSIEVTPLRLENTRTAVLSISDWKALQLHWIFDSEKTYRETDEALENLLNTFNGTVVFVDDAEKEGHVYFVHHLSQHGILVVISSNLDSQALHLKNKEYHAVNLSGKDHRVGDIAEVCISAGEHELFDTVRDQQNIPHQQYEKFRVVQRGESRVAYSRWSDLRNQPLLKEHFATYLKKHKIEAVLIDEFPFFSDMKGSDIDLMTLGHIYRFVHLVDAVHDLQLPFMLRTDSEQKLSSDYVGAELEEAFQDYDRRLNGKEGATTWIEVTRCLSRLRSRQKLNEAFFPAFLEAEEVIP